jgi:hypothetical protein
MNDGTCSTTLHKINVISPIEIGLIMQLNAKDTELLIRVDVITPIRSTDKAVRRDIIAHNTARLADNIKRVSEINANWGSIKAIANRKPDRTGILRYRAILSRTTGTGGSLGTRHE